MCDSLEKKLIISLIEQSDNAKIVRQLKYIVI